MSDDRSESYSVQRKVEQRGRTKVHVWGNLLAELLGDKKEVGSASCLDTQMVLTMVVTMEMRKEETLVRQSVVLLGRPKESSKGKQLVVMSVGNSDKRRDNLTDGLLGKYWETRSALL